jgi:VIT1/CCC1 family predicted Fe2+/Mn2+ transporter
MTALTPKLKRSILNLQRGEITEMIIYRRLADVVVDHNNRAILNHIADDERRHYEFWRDMTGTDLGPGRLRVFFYYVMARTLGITFTLKLLERGEESAQVAYAQLSGAVPDVRKIIADENEHEKELVDLIDEERLRYVGSMVLGLSDALVELTGTLAGFTLALSNAKVIAAAGLITGIAAALSMAASEFQSTRSEGNEKNPLKASVYTGVVYLGTVLLLVVPFLLLSVPLVSLALTTGIALIIIISFTFYLSVAQDLPFFRRFVEMAVIIFGVATLSFLIGWAVKAVFNINI